jgi:hypothetical protein
MTTDANLEEKLRQSIAAVENQHHPCRVARIEYCEKLRGKK